VGKTTVIYVKFFHDIACSTTSTAVARIADHTGCQWPSRSSKIDDFYVIWKPICDFLAVINSNLSPISHCFQDIATYSLKHFIPQCVMTLQSHPRSMTYMPFGSQYATSY